MTDWSHQPALYEQCCAAARKGHRRILVQLATGGGKTRFAAEYLAARHVRKGGRVLWLAPSSELAGQAEKALERAGLTVGLELAGQPNPKPGAPVQVALVQGVLANPDRFGAPSLVIVDECHRILASAWRETIHAFGGTLVGLSATPVRQDGRAFGAEFQALVCGPSHAELVRRGVLVPARVFAPPSRLSGECVDPVEAYLRHASGLQAFVFGSTLEHCGTLAERFNRASIASAVVEGTMPDEERDTLLTRFRAGELRALVSVRLLAEGVDVPNAQTCVFASGCASVASYLQKVGRVLRAAPGKVEAIVLDCVGSVHEHGLPDEPREFSLEGKPIRLSAHERLPLRQCASCGATYRAGPRQCPRCGATAPPPPAPRLSRERLAELAARDSDDKRVEFFRKQLAIASSHSYAPKWAAVRFKTKYGHWPSKAIREAAAQ